MKKIGRITSSLSLCNILITQFSYLLLHISRQLYFVVAASDDKDDDDDDTVSRLSLLVTFIFLCVSTSSSSRKFGGP